MEEFKSPNKELLFSRGGRAARVASKLYYDAVKAACRYDYCEYSFPSNTFILINALYNS